MGAKFNKDVLIKYSITRGAFEVLLDIVKAYNDKDSKVLLKKAYKFAEEIKRGYQIKNQYYNTPYLEGFNPLKAHLINTILCVTSTENDSDEQYARDYGLIISSFKQQGIINDETYESLCDTIAKTFNVIRKEGTYNGDAMPTVFEKED